MTTTSSAAGKKKPASGQLIVLLSLGSLVLGGLTYQYLTRPVMAQTQAVRAEADTLERKLESQMLLIEQLPQLRQENTRLEGQLVELRREFPNSEQLDQRLVDIEDTALGLGMTIAGFKRTVEDSGIQGVDRLKLSTAVIGTYGQLTALMEAMVAKDRFTNIEGIEMAMTGQGLATKMDIYSYMLRPTPASTGTEGAGAVTAPADGAPVTPGTTPTPEAGAQPAAQPSAGGPQ